MMQQENPTENRLEKYDIIFIDQNGNMIASDDIKTHTEFKKVFKEENPDLIERFKSSNYTNLTLFLVCEEGYMQAGKLGEYRGLMYDSSKITPIQKQFLSLFERRGYDIEDLVKGLDEEER